MPFWGWILMPAVFAFVFLYNFLKSLTKIRNNEPLDSEMYLACIFFALMVGTIAAAIFFSGKI